jgi:hypothetical protein
MHRGSHLWFVVAVLSSLAMPSAVHSQGRTPSGPVGASMALLATLQDAAILPPEGTPAANRIVQTVIQFQSLFMKTTDVPVRAFMDGALEAKFAARAGDVGQEFRTRGWTSEIIEALCDRYRTLPDDERRPLAGSFARVNMRPDDFELLCGLYTDARTAFDQQGRNIHRIFAEHRRRMPGGKQFDRKEKRDGDESLHTHQSQDGPDQGRAPGLEKATRSRTGPFMLRPA